MGARYRIRSIRSGRVNLSIGHLGYERKSHPTRTSETRSGYALPQRSEKTPRYNRAMLSKEALEADLRTAMKAGDDLRKRTLRMILAAIKLGEVEKRGPLDEASLTAILQREIKTRRESITDAERAHRDDLIAASQAEIDVVQSFLPQRLSADNLQSMVRKAIEETGASGPQDMGKVMKAVMPHVQGRADGKDVNELVRSLLAQA